MCYNTNIHNSFTRKTGKFRSFVYVWGFFLDFKLKIPYKKVIYVCKTQKGVIIKLANNKGGNTVGKVFELAKPLADELGLILWDVCFEKEGANWYLRVFIDKEDGVDLEACESFSRPFNKILDDTDMIDQSYIFEVGSVGIARELKRPEHFEQFIGSPVKIRFIRAVDNVKEIIAQLKSFNKDSITVLVDDTETEIKLSDTAFVKLNDDEDLFA